MARIIVHRRSCADSSDTVVSSNEIGQSRITLISKHKWKIVIAAAVFLICMCICLVSIIYIHKKYQLPIFEADILVECKHKIPRTNLSEIITITKVESELRGIKPQKEIVSQSETFSQLLNFIIDEVNGLSSNYLEEFRKSTERINELANYDYAKKFPKFKYKMPSKKFGIQFLRDYLILLGNYINLIDITLHETKKDNLKQKYPSTIKSLERLLSSENFYYGFLAIKELLLENIDLLFSSLIKKTPQFQTENSEYFLLKGELERNLPDLFIEEEIRQSVQIEEDIYEIIYHRKVSDWVAIKKALSWYGVWMYSFLIEDNTDIGGSLRPELTVGLNKPQIDDLRKEVEASISDTKGSYRLLKDWLGRDSKSNSHELDSHAWENYSDSVGKILDLLLNKHE